MKGFTPHHFWKKNSDRSLPTIILAKKSGGGVTFIEFLLTIAIIAILIALTIPLGISFYKTQQLDTTGEGVVQALRRAQLKAMSQTDYSFGVYIGSGQTGQYILFRGSSYGNHDDEEVFDIAKDISFNGLPEVVFSKLGGIPSTIGDIVLTSSVGTRVININELGRINYGYPPGCWAIEGLCDSLCQYSSHGPLVDYYTDPDCSASCSPAGSFYPSPSGVCSNDGTGSCYKMENLLSASTTCSQGDPCEYSCTGTCTSCEQLNRQQCRNQRGCRWTAGQCVDWPGCTPCDQFPDPDSCGPGPSEPQYGCSWEATKWWWNLANPLEGYLASTTCQWLEL